MKCSESSPCYCYGNLCIKGDYCNAGIAYWKRKPICGQRWGDEDKYGSKLFCKQLGFQKIVDVGYKGFSDGRR